MVYEGELAAVWGHIFVQSGRAGDPAEACPTNAKKRAVAGSLARPRPPVNSLAVFPGAVSQSEVQLLDSFVGGADGRRLMAPEIVRRRSHVIAGFLQRGNGVCDAWVHGAFVLRK